MSVIKVDYGEVGGNEISKESGMLTANVPLRIKATNCLFLLFDYRDASDAWSNSTSNTVAWCGVHEKNFVSYTASSITMTYDTTTETMTITTTDSRWSSYLIFGDYEVLT